MKKYKPVVKAKRARPQIRTLLGLVRDRIQPTNGRERNAASEKSPIKNPISLGPPPKLSKKRGRSVRTAIEE